MSSQSGEDGTAGQTDGDSDAAPPESPRHENERLHRSRNRNRIWAGVMTLVAAAALANPIVRDATSCRLDTSAPVEARVEAAHDVRPDGDIETTMTYELPKSCDRTDAGIKGLVEALSDGADDVVRPSTTTTTTTTTSTTTTTTTSTAPVTASPPG